MKKYLCVTLLIIVGMFQSFLVLASGSISGDGSENSPFIITTQEELEIISDFTNSHFVLGSNITLSGNWTPLCSYEEPFTGVLDGNGYTISNLTVSNHQYAGLFASNNGTIMNLKVETSNKGVISNYRKYKGVVYAGGITAYNKNDGVILKCSVTGKISSQNTYYSGSDSERTGQSSSAGGITAHNDGNVHACIFRGDIDASIYKRLPAYDATVTASGIAGNNNGEIENCYAIASISAYYSAIGIGEGATNSYFSGKLYSSYSTTFRTPVGYLCSNSFYDKKTTGIDTTDKGMPKTTIAMKMPATYVNSNWDFDTIWAIDAEHNDGYPYLQWEYPSEPEPTPEPDSIVVEIVDVAATDNSLKFISAVGITGTPEVDSFGTTFIPLSLFDDESAKTAKVSYDNYDYDIQNGQTYGATLSGIPESCKDWQFVGKSYVKDADRNYVWSVARSASINDTILNTIE